MSASKRATPLAESDEPAVTPLSGPADALLAHPAASGLAKRLWGALPRSCQAGLPQRILPRDLARWQRRDDVQAELVRVPQDAASRALLLLPRRDAARLVDHVLGGDGQLGEVATLGQAECGVLAYALGRVLAELDLPYQVEGVSDANTLLVPREPSDVPLIAWPLLLHTELGALDLRLVLTSGAALRVPGCYELQLVLRDTLGPAAPAPRLAPGDLLVSDRWPLTATTAGLEGSIDVRVLGSSELRAATLSQGCLQISSAPSSTFPAGAIELVLARLTFPFTGLAEVLSGVPLPLSQLPSASVQVRRDDRPWAVGQLIVRRGELGVRIEALAQSMR